jgi:hypothetical protein
MSPRWIVRLGIATPPGFVIDGAQRKPLDMDRCIAYCTEPGNLFESPAGPERELLSRPNSLHCRKRSTDYARLKGRPKTVNFDYRDLLNTMTSGLRLTNAQDVVLKSPSAEGPFEKTVACYLEFGGLGLLLEAVRETDGIRVLGIPSISEWLTDRQSRYAREDFGDDEFSVTLQSSVLIRRTGLPLCDYWACMDEMGIIDAVDFAFGNLLYPTDKVICIASELTFLEITR